MANPEHLEILAQGVERWNKWREDNPDVLPDLREADLSGANLREVDFSRALLHKTNLSETDLSDANLSDADLSDADLWYADCSGVNLYGARLCATKLINTILDGAILTGACLWAIQRTNWSINGIICEYVYWGYLDPEGFENLPSNDVEKRFYAPGGFERLYAEKTKVRLFYKDSINPLEIATLPALIKHLEESHPGSSLRLVSIHEDSGGVVVELAIEDVGEHSPEQLKQVRAEIERTAQRAVEYERKFLAEEKIRGQVEARLDELRVLFREQMKLLTSANQTIVKGDNIMGDKYNVSGQAGTVGHNAHANDMTFNQIVNRFEQTSDLLALATPLEESQQDFEKLGQERKNKMKPEGFTSDPKFPS